MNELVTYAGKQYKSLRVHMGKEPSNKDYWLHAAAKEALIIPKIKESPKPVILKSKEIARPILRRDDRGKDGVNGIKGDKGEAGDKGLKGFDGLPGPKGDKGEPGISGRDGVSGKDGKDGKHGKNGKDGVGLRYILEDTRLGIKREDEDYFNYLEFPKGKLGNEKGKRDWFGIGGSSHFRLTSVTGNNNLIYIAKTSNATLKNLAAGANVSISDNGVGTLTIASTGGGGGTGLTWSTVTSISNTGVSNNGYITNNIAQVTVGLPNSSTVGDILAIVGRGTGGWKISQGAGQTIHFESNDTTTGTSGSLTSQTRYDCVEMICIIANTDWVVRTSQGNIIIS